MDMTETFILNESIKKSSFTVLMLESMGWKLVDSTEVGTDVKDGLEQGSPKYVRLSFQRDDNQKSILFW